MRRVFTGEAGIVIDAEGRGLDIASATINADLSQAQLALPETGWTKPANTPASARIDVARRDDGGFVLSNAVLTAPGARLTGRIELAADGRLEKLELDRLEIDRFVSAEARIARGQEGAVVADVRGAYADVRGLV